VLPRTVRGKAMAKKLRITQVRSAIGRQFDQKGTLKALGIRKLNQTVIKDDVPQIRGMIRKISHLVVVEEFEEKEKVSKKTEKGTKNKEEGKSRIRKNNETE